MSMVLTGGSLGKLGNVELIPESEYLSKLNLPDNVIATNLADIAEMHRVVGSYLDKNEVELAWKILVSKR